MTKTILPLLLMSCIATQSGFAQGNMQASTSAVNSASQAHSMNTPAQSSTGNGYSQFNAAAYKPTEPQGSVMPYRAQPNLANSNDVNQNRVNYSPNSSSSTANYLPNGGYDKNYSVNYYSRTIRNITLPNNADKCDSLSYISKVLALQAAYRRWEQTDSVQNRYKYVSTMYGYNHPAPYYTSSIPASDALFRELPGYIVYGRDTLAGLVLLTDNSIVFSDATASRLIPYDDDALSAAAVIDDNNNILHLARINDDDLMLSRVLHNGKLMIYDNVYSFDIDNYAIGQIKTASNSQPHRPFVILDPYLYLVRTVNKTYGLKLKPAEYTFSSLMDQVKQLD